MPTCNGCDKQFRDEDLAPYMRNDDGTRALACRKCISDWIKEGILWPTFPFWMRKEGKDV